jgi:hypothetical protein
VNVVAALIQGGVVTAVLAFVLALVRIAIGSERRRADDWRTAAETREAANAVQAGHVEKLVSSVGQLTTSVGQLMAAQQQLSASLEQLAAGQQRVLSLLAEQPRSAA